MDRCRVRLSGTRWVVLAAALTFCTSASVPAQNDSFLYAAEAGPLATDAPGTATERDRHFVFSTAQDTNFEIVTGRLALEKSKAANIRAYARMVIHDHTQLRQMIFVANKAIGAKNIGTISMTPDDLTTYTRLQGLSDGDFDQLYVSVLLKGNEQGLDEARAEAAGSSVPAVKSLAARRAELDSKHSAKARELSQSH